MSAINRTLRAASAQTIRLPTRAVRAQALNRINFINPAIRTSAALRTSSFSTMSKLQSGAPPAPVAREYDPEIKDIASYVHNTPIDSDLAVRNHSISAKPGRFSPLTQNHSTTPHASSSSTL